MSADQADRQFVERVRLHARPKAHQDAVVERGDARFTILTPRLIRLEWAPGGTHDDRGSYAFPTRYAEQPPSFRVSEAKGWLVIDTGPLVLRYKTDSGRFDAENLSVRLSVAGRDVEWRPGMSNPGNLFGARRTLDGCWAEATIDPRILSRDGWVLFDDSGTVRLREEDEWIAAPADEPRQDWYFFGYGHDYKAALTEYRRFGHDTPLIPRYVLGLWWSKYWEYGEQDLKDLARLFDLYEVPLDVMVIDMDWHLKDHWTGYTWNRDFFPDPEGFLKWTKEQGLRTTLNLHPAAGVQKFEAMYKDFAEAMGQDPKTGKPVTFRISDPHFARLYFEMLHHPLESQGVDFWWMDWQQGATSELKGLDPLIWLNHLHFNDMYRTGQRPMLFSRWGGLGNHRYPIGFSGDSFATWPILDYMPFFTATASNVAYGWWSHDIGAHFGACSPEQYVRWVQFGALSPCLRLHSSKNASYERRPWAFGDEALTHARRAVHLRYKLLPYLYTTARQTTDTNVGPCRPMYYEHPGREEAYAARWQYYLGDQMIAAPIVSPAVAGSEVAGTAVWLPEGRWTDYTTLETHDGPCWVRASGGWERLPLFVKAGGIIPVADVASRSERIRTDILKLKVFPGGSGAYTHYEDDNISEQYRDGACEWTSVVSEISGDTCTVSIGPVEGACEGLPQSREVEVAFVARKRPAKVSVDGAAFDDWGYDENTGTVTVPLPARSKSEAAKIAVEAAPLDVQKRGESFAVERAGRILGIDGEVNRETLLQQACAREGAAGDEAIACLGGPFVKAYDFTTPPEVHKALGYFILGAPQKSDMTFHGEWTLYRSADVCRFPIEEQTSGAGQVCYTPFAFGEEVRAQRFELTLNVAWQGCRRTYRFASRPLLPSVPRWHWALIDRSDASLDHRSAADKKGKLNPKLDWKVSELNPKEVWNLSIGYWFPWPQEMIDRLLADKEPTQYAVALFDCPEERRAVLQFDEPRGGHLPVQDARFYFNGEELEMGPEKRTAEVTLKKGLNRIVVHIHLVGRDVLCLYVLDASGVPMIDLAYH